jgi:hypothetical protein
MYIGPIHPVPQGFTTGHNPVKPIKVATTEGKSAVLFDSTYPYALQSDVPATQFDTVIYQNTPAQALATLHQIEELTQNAEWQRCGVYIQWREDGVQDGEDGWYIIKSAEISEDYIFSGYAEPKIEVELRARKAQTIGTFVDSKAVPNDYNLSGVGLAAFPQGLGVTIFPTATWTYSGFDGSQISVVENPPQIMKGNLQTPVGSGSVSANGRCACFDATSNDSTQTEVFWKDHVNLNGNWEFTNQLVKYIINTAGGEPFVQVNNAGAWNTVGQLQLVTGFATIQAVQLGTISPEEVTWTEDRIGNGYFFKVQGRIRRGSRIIEMAVVAAGNLSNNLGGAIQLINIPSAVTGALLTPDGTGVTSVGGVLEFGFNFLSKPANLLAGAGGSLQFGTGIQGNQLSQNQASLEAGTTTGWGLTSNCSITNTTAQALDGTHSLQLSSTAAGTMSTATTTTIPVTQGQTYTAIANFRTAVSGRSCTVQINWGDNNTLSLSSSVSSSVTDTTGGWTKASVTAVAPTDAAFATVTVTVLSTGGAAEVHYVDEISFAVGSSPNWSLPPASGTAVLDSGYTLPAGTVTRFGIFAGTQDAQWTAYARPGAVTGLTATAQGTTGAATYGYAVYALSQYGTYSLSAIASVSNGNATLSAGNNVKLSWTAASGDVSYIITRRSVAGGSPSTIGVIGTTTSTTFTDTGLAVSNPLTDFSQGQVFATTMSSYNRQRIRQRILVGG